MTKTTVSAKSHPELSIVIPVYNEENNVAPLFSEILQVMDGKSFEVIFVDDGSTDATLPTLKKLCKTHPELRIIRFKRNFKKAAAYSAGFAHAKGRIVITMDGDMQDNPGEIPCFLTKMNEGYDVVTGWKYEGKGKFFRRVPSKIFNFVISSITGIRLGDFNCPFKAYRKEVLDNIRIYGELHRFIPVLADRKGYKIAEIKVANRPRASGSSKYGIERFWRGFFDTVTVLLISRYSDKPLHLFGFIALILFSLGIGINVYVILRKFFVGVAFGASMGLLTLGLIILTGAFNLFSVGLILEFIISRDSTSEDQYTIDEIL